jgi:hypothetical protein
VPIFFYVSQLKAFDIATKLVHIIIKNRKGHKVRHNTIPADRNAVKKVFDNEEIWALFIAGKSYLFFVDTGSKDMNLPEELNLFDSADVLERARQKNFTIQHLNLLRFLYKGKKLAEAAEEFSLTLDGVKAQLTRIYELFTVDIRHTLPPGNSKFRFVIHWLLYGDRIAATG